MTFELVTKMKTSSYINCTCWIFQWVYLDKFATRVCMSAYCRITCVIWLRNSDSTQRVIWAIFIFTLLLAANFLLLLLVHIHYFIIFGVFVYSLRNKNTIYIQFHVHRESPDAILFCILIETKFYFDFCERYFHRIRLTCKNGNRLTFYWPEKGGRQNHMSRCGKHFFDVLMLFSDSDLILDDMLMYHTLRWFPKQSQIDWRRCFPFDFVESTERYNWTHYFPNVGKPIFFFASRINFKTESARHSD